METDQAGWRVPADLPVQHLELESRVGLVVDPPPAQDMLVQADPAAARVDLEHHLVGEPVDADEVAWGVVLEVVEQVVQGGHNSLLCWGGVISPRRADDRL